MSLAFQNLRGVCASTWTSAAFAELAHLAADLDLRAAAVDEVELVLLLVEVEEALEARRIDDAVDAESRDAERAAHLAEARPVAELVQR